MAAEENLMAKQGHELIALSSVVLGTLAWSIAAPADRFTWWLEAAPVLLIGPVLVLTRKRFPLSPLLYRLIAVHAVILLVGARYTYAEVPLGFWLQDAFRFSRNHYDRIGHLAQGFIPAILARELLLRTSPLKRGGWLFVVVLSMCLAFSACYEILEWWSAAWGGETAEAFLGTQGDVWDAQWDMFCALIGACAALVLLGKAHDKSLRRSEFLEDSAEPRNE